MTNDDLLALATEHVAKGEACVARQIATIERLTLGGHPTDLAKQLLEAMRVSLCHMTEDRDHILQLHNLAKQVAISN
jgi:hypothetical protein